MNRAAIEKLGLTVREADNGQLEAELSLTFEQLLNPLSRRFLSKVVFTVVNDRLIVIEPPELVGSPPIALANVNRGADIEQALAQSLTQNIFQLQRRSAELTALGLHPRVDPNSLELTTELTTGEFQFVLATDRQGNFRVARTLRAGRELTTSSVHVFELSEFRERGALESYLVALFSGDAAAAPGRNTRSRIGDPLVSFGDIVDRFGVNAIVPPRSALEILVELQVGKKLYRFAAARVSGRTFRGLLAGSEGKLWAERFDLESFSGVKALAAEVLGVSAEQVELLRSSTRGA